MADETTHNQARLLLRKAAAQFRYYAKNHRAKVPALEKLAGATKQIADTQEKARDNDALAAEIEEFLK